MITIADNALPSNGGSIRLAKRAAPGDITGSALMHRYAFHLHLSSEQFLDYYRGAAKNVIVRAHGGQTVQFPASLLQRHVLAEGIHGEFVLTCDDNHKCLSLEKIFTA